MKNNIEKFIIEKNKNTDLIESVSDKLEAIKCELNGISDFPKYDEIVNIISSAMDEYEKPITENKKELNNFFLSKMKKFYKMKVIKYAFDREYVREYLIFIYDYVKFTNTFFCLKSSELNNSYSIKLDDCTFNAEDYLDGYKYDIIMEEITKDEFKNIITNKINSNIKYRIDKLCSKSENTKLDF